LSAARSLTVRHEQTSLFAALFCYSPEATGPDRTAPSSPARHDWIAKRDNHIDFAQQAQLRKSRNWPRNLT
jgi:hypothetical protein